MLGKGCADQVFRLLLALGQWDGFDWRVMGGLRPPLAWATLVSRSPGQHRLLGSKGQRPGDLSAVPAPLLRLGEPCESLARFFGRTEGGLLDLATLPDATPFPHKRPLPKKGGLDGHVIVPRHVSARVDMGEVATRGHFPRLPWQPNGKSWCETLHSDARCRLA